MIRLDPPYLAAICLIIPLGYLCAMAPGFRGPAYHVSVSQVLLHFAYLNSFFKDNWVNPVFWTLGIEFQYYLLVGLLFPLIASRRRWLRYTVFAGFGGLAVIFSPASARPFVFHWIFLFMLGMTAFHWHCGVVGKWEFMGLMFLLSAAAWASLGWADATVGLATACAILFINSTNAITQFFGRISYSLYLIHNPTGVKTINLGMRIASSWRSQLLLLLVGLGVSLVAASALYRWVEKPAQKWSSAITYNPHRHVA
jgi:peptidoglycan/LPS O-acetylase OafA/YrhL